MKSTINKSRLMKNAWRMVRYENFDMSTAMKLAWIDERRKAANEAEEREYAAMRERAAKAKSERKERGETIGDVMFGLGKSLINYYANNTYNGD